MQVFKSYFHYFLQDYSFTCQADGGKALDEGRWWGPSPGRLSPGKEKLYPSYKRPRRFQDRLVWGRKILPSQKIELRPSISLLVAKLATIFRLPVPSLQIKWSSRFEIWPHLTWINFFRKNMPLLPWRWRQHVLAKRWKIFTPLHEVMQRFNIRKRSS
jgi:hypothetical protein